jgi:methylated-DNA-[protein]-cysteine S-methyltransferase
MSDIQRVLEKASHLEVSAATAGALKRALGQADELGLLDVAWKRVDSPVGPLLLANTSVGVVRLAFEQGHLDSLLCDLAERVSPGVVEFPSRLDPVHRELDEYFAQRRRIFDLAIDWRLTRPGFGRGVLEAAARIPYGASSTYRQIAAAAGNPKASRAAGNALGANPICLLIPCHRVLRSDGGVGGYGGGPERKQQLLELEGCLPGKTSKK